jgi:translational activator of cytochrome c oxidase 1
MSSVQKASVMWMFKKVGCVDVKFPKPEGSSATEEQDKVLDLAMANDMEDFDVVESDEEGKQIMKVCDMGVKSLL